MSRATLHARLVRSHLLVILVAVMAMFVIGAFLATVLFAVGLDDGGIPGGDAIDVVVSTEVGRSFVAATLWGLLAGVLGAIIAAALVARTVSRSIVGEVRQVRRATQRMAAGRFDERAPRPEATELGLLADDVNALAAQLEAREQRLADALGGVADALDDPLRSIERSAEALLTGAATTPPATFAQIAADAGALRRVSRELLDVVHGPVTQADLDLALIDLCDVVQSAVATVADAADKRSIRIDTSALQPVNLMGDRVELRRVVTQLIQNAVQFAEVGGSVRLASSSSPTRAIVTVTDDGRGLEADDRQRIFERFYQADSSAAEGNGVGLAVARELARAHGGDVFAESPGPGRGSTFTIALPVAGPPS